MVFPITKAYTQAMRLFYALTFDEQTLSRLSCIQDSLVPLLEKGRKSAKHNLHLTLSFLGNQEPRLLPLFKEIVAALPNTPINLQFSHLGRFTKSGGDVIWLGIQRNVELLHLQSMLVEHLSKCRVPISDTSFTAHVTLFRNARIAELPSFSPFSCTSQAIRLMLSHQLENVLVYTPLASNFLLGN